MNSKSLQDKKKAKMLEALPKAMGIVTQACKMVGIARQTHYNWLQNDPQYKADIEALSLDDLVLDFVESSLYTAIKKGNVTAIIYYLNHKGAKRGYFKDGDQQGPKELPPIEIQIVDAPRAEAEIIDYEEQAPNQE